MYNKSVFLFLFCLSLSSASQVREEGECPVSLDQCTSSKTLKDSLKSLDHLMSKPGFVDAALNFFRQVFNSFIQPRANITDIIGSLLDLRDYCYEERPIANMNMTRNNNEFYGPLPTDDSMNCSSNDDPMKMMLDAMEEMNTGEGTYDDEYYVSLHNCFDAFHDNLSASQIEAWRGIVKYWENGGDDWDPWGGNNGSWYEYNATDTSVCNLTIYEPCNYASNVAYYHIVTEICSHWNYSRFNMDDAYVVAIAEAFSMVGMGSSFMHGTNTLLGQQQDHVSNQLFPYAQYQAALSSLENASSILTDLSFTKREKTSIEIADEVTTMYLNESVFDWYNHTNTFDMPTIEATFTAFFTTAFSIFLPEEDVLCLVLALTCPTGVPEDIVNFTINCFLPELNEAIEGLQITSVEKVQFMGNTLGTILKLIYALLFQEDVLEISQNITQYDVVNAIGGCLLPTYNVAAGQLQTFPYYDGDFQLGYDIYPGDYGYCNMKGGHPKWHLESAIGTLDVTYMADQMNNFFSRLYE